MNAMLDAALSYTDEGLCVIPVKPRDKAPALPTWEAYQHTCSCRDEVRDWFSNGAGYNVGIVHGKVSGGYVTLDFDHDSGLFEKMSNLFPFTFAGRLEQSGSQQGFHVPLIVDELPDFGYNQNQERPRGNKTWKTEMGDCNIRAQFCQTVAPPSIHPTGNRYTFIKEGEMQYLEDLNDIIEWLNKAAPPAPPRRPVPVANRTSSDTQLTSCLVEAVKSVWNDSLQVFRHFNIVNQTQIDRDGDIRIPDNGGLLVQQDNHALWYCFSDEIGGDQIDAWGWCRYGSAFDRNRHFRETLLEMAQAAGLDVTAFYRRGDENVTAKMQQDGERDHWTSQYKNRWRSLR